ncbi:MAG: hypothetical protein ABIG20_04190 [archaeon]
MYEVIFAAIIVMIGWVAGSMIYMGWKEMSPGLTKRMMAWLMITVIGCGFPYAFWNFFLYAGVVNITNPFYRELPGNLLMALFFVLMLKTGHVAKEMGVQYGFAKQNKKVEEAIKKG